MDFDCVSFQTPSNAIQREAIRRAWTLHEYQALKGSHPSVSSDWVGYWDVFILIYEWNIRVHVNTSSDAKVIDEACSPSVSYWLQHFGWRLTEELNVNPSCSMPQIVTDRERGKCNMHTSRAAIWGQRRHLKAPRELISEKHHQRTNMLLKVCVCVCMCAG